MLLMMFSPGYSLFIIIMFATKAGNFKEVSNKYIPRMYWNSRRWKSIFSNHDRDRLEP